VSKRSVGRQVQHVRNIIERPRSVPLIAKQIAPQHAHIPWQVPQFAESRNGPLYPSFRRVVVLSPNQAHDIVVKTRIQQGRQAGPA
jgi:hypothetical protein